MTVEKNTCVFEWTICKIFKAVGEETIVLAIENDAGGTINNNYKNIFVFECCNIVSKFQSRKCLNCREFYNFELSIVAFRPATACWEYFKVLFKMFLHMFHVLRYRNVSKIFILICGDIDNNYEVPFYPWILELKQTFEGCMVCSVILSAFDNLSAPSWGHIVLPIQVALMKLRPIFVVIWFEKHLWERLFLSLLSAFRHFVSEFEWCQINIWNVTVYGMQSIMLFSCLGILCAPGYKKSLSKNTKVDITK